MSQKKTKLVHYWTVMLCMDLNQLLSLLQLL